MSRWLRSSDHYIQRIYENMEVWARDEIARLCEEWCAYQITSFEVAPYYFSLTALCWQGKPEHRSFATSGKHLVIRPRLLRIAEAGSEITTSEKL